MSVKFVNLGKTSVQKDKMGISLKFSLIRKEIKLQNLILIISVIAEWSYNFVLSFFFLFFPELSTYSY